MGIPWYDYLFMLCIGVAFIYAGVLQRRKRGRLLGNGIKVEGVVFELADGGSTRNSTFYYPVIRFLTMEKEWVAQKYDIGGSSNVYHIGDKVKVIYDPENPTNFTIDDTRAKVAGPLFKVIGIIILSFELLLFILSLLLQIKTP